MPILSRGAEELLQSVSGLGQAILIAACLMPTYWTVISLLIQTQDGFGNSSHENVGEGR
jgi:hypothetical protein